MNFHEDKAVLTLRVGDPSPVVLLCRFRFFTHGQRDRVTMMGSGKCPGQSPIQVLGIFERWLACRALSMGFLPGLPYTDFQLLCVFSDGTSLAWPGLD